MPANLKRYDFMVQRVISSLVAGEDLFIKRAPARDDLVLLTKRPESTFYLSIVITALQQEYQLSSLKTGQLAWFQTDDMKVFSQKFVKEHPQLSWRDEYFDFQYKLNNIIGAFPSKYLIKIKCFSGVYVQLDVKDRFFPKRNPITTPSFMIKNTPRSIRKIIKDAIEDFENGPIG